VDLHRFVASGEGLNMYAVWLQDNPIESLESILGFVIGLLQAMGLYNWVVGAVFGVVVLGLTFRLIDGIGGRG
jgi:hypothetical protein